MPTAPIPFNVSQASSEDPLVKGEAVVASINGWVDTAGALRRRPGLTAYDTGTHSAVIGATVWRDHLVYVTADRQIHARTPTDVQLDLSNLADSTTLLAGTGRAVFAGTRDKLVIAGGQELQKWEINAALTERLGGSPPRTTHVIALADRLFAPVLGLTGQIRWSSAGEGSHETWPALNFATAEARPDTILGVYGTADEAWFFGTETLEIWVPDPQLVLAPQATIEVGYGAAYSAIALEGGGFAWLDDQRQFVVSNGRAVEVISPGLVRTLEGLSTVTDCHGFRVVGEDILVWVFPTEEKAFAFESKGGRWGEWKGYVTDPVGEYAVTPHTAYAYWSSKNRHMVGTAARGMAMLDWSAHDDLGSILKLEIRTGFENRGTSKQKICERVRVRMRRGLDDGTSSTARLSLYYRDDEGPLGGPIEFEVGTAGVVVPFLEHGPLGTYRQRQWVMVATDPVAFSVAAIEEDFEVLEY